jgi:hypothetical protein
MMIELDPLYPKVRPQFTFVVKMPGRIIWHDDGTWNRDTITYRINIGAKSENEAYQMVKKLLRTNLLTIHADMAAGGREKEND